MEHNHLSNCYDNIAIIMDGTIGNKSVKMFYLIAKVGIVSVADNYEIFLFSLFSVRIEKIVLKFF